MGVFERIQHANRAARDEKLSPPAEIQKTKAVRFPTGTALPLAKTQEAGQSDGKISVKLLDAAGAVTGDAFDVFAFRDQATSNMDDYLPKIPNADFVFVVKAADGNWFLVDRLIKKGVATDAVATHSATDSIFAAAMNPIGRH